MKSLIGQESRRRLAWSGVALALAIELGATAANMAQLHADRAHMDFITLWGVIPLTDLFYAYTLAHVAAVPAGLWLVVTAIRRNRGRVWWRWWAAGLLLFLPVVALYPVLATGKFISEGYYNLGGLYLVLLSPSLWILGEPDRTA